MFSPKTQKYLHIFFYASIFWIVIGTLHLTSISVGDIQDGEQYDLSPQRWVLFLTTYFSWAFLTTFVYFLVERKPPSKGNWRWLPTAYFRSFTLMTSVPGGVPALGLEGGVTPPNR